LNLAMMLEHISKLQFPTEERFRTMWINEWISGKISGQWAKMDSSAQVHVDKAILNQL
jgi:hypothetical protein